MLNSVNICWEFSWSLVFLGEPFIAMLIKRDQRIRDLHYFAAGFYAVLGVIEIERNWPARYVLYICDISSRLRFEDWFSENTNSLCLFVDWQNFRMIIDYSVSENKFADLFLTWIVDNLSVAKFSLTAIFHLKILRNFVNFHADSASDLKQVKIVH